MLAEVFLQAFCYCRWATHPIIAVAIAIITAAFSAFLSFSHRLLAWVSFHLFKLLHPQVWVSFHPVTAVTVLVPLTAPTPSCKGRACRST